MLQRPICPKGAAVSPLSANTLQVPKVESGQSSSLGLLDHTSPLVVQVLGVLVAWVEPLSPCSKLYPFFCASSKSEMPSLSG